MDLRPPGLEQSRVVVLRLERAEQVIRRHGLDHRAAVLEQRAAQRDRGEGRVLDVEARELARRAVHGASRLEPLRVARSVLGEQLAPRRVVDVARALEHRLRRRREPPAVDVDHRLLEGVHRPRVAHQRLDLRPAGKRGWRRRPGRARAPEQAAE